MYFKKSMTDFRNVSLCKKEVLKNCDFEIIF